MVSYLKKDELIYGYIEWEVVDQEGKFDNQGEYIYIQDVWINKYFRGWRTLRKLIRLIDRHPFTRTTKYVYWEHEKYNFHIKIYKKELFTKRSYKDENIPMSVQ